VFFHFISFEILLQKCGHFENVAIGFRPRISTRVKEIALFGVVSKIRIQVFNINDRIQRPGMAPPKARNDFTPSF
jgi:hypothetical protein